MPPCKCASEARGDKSKFSSINNSEFTLGLDASREFPSEPFITRALKPRITSFAAHPLARRSSPRSPRIPSLAVNSLARPFVHTAPAPLFAYVCGPRSPLIYSHNLDSLAQPVLTRALFLPNAPSLTLASFAGTPTSSPPSPTPRPYNPTSPPSLVPPSSTTISTVTLTLLL